MAVNFESLLPNLAQQRPAFHSEADFQHALAWAWQQADSSASIRLEYRVPIDGERAYADLWVRDGSGITYVELKYWTRGLDVDVHDERFLLSNQAAQDLSRYDFLKDLARVERVVGLGIADRGHVLALTNDRGYWGTPRAGTVDSNFRLHDGRLVTGELAWAEQAGAGTIRGRERPILVAGTYPCRWRDYSDLGVRGGAFRYLLMSVKGDEVE